MAESAKAKTSASCPATIGNKSTSPTPTPLVDVGTPATFYMDSPQDVQEYLSRARAGLQKDKRVKHTRLDPKLNSLADGCRWMVKSHGTWQKFFGKPRRYTVGCTH